jgi:hypothetical protein
MSTAPHSAPPTPPRDVVETLLQINERRFGEPTPSKDFRVGFLASLVACIMHECPQADHYMRLRLQIAIDNPN